MNKFNLKIASISFTMGIIKRIFQKTMSLLNFNNVIGI